MTADAETITRMLTDRDTAARNWQALADQRELLIQQQREEIDRLRSKIVIIRKILDSAY